MAACYGIDETIRRYREGSDPWERQFGRLGRFPLIGDPEVKIVRPKQVPKIIQQVYFIGAKSTMIIMLVGLFTGMVMGLQYHHALVKVGAGGALGTLVVLSRWSGNWGPFSPPS